MSEPGESVATTDRTLIRRAGANLVRGLGGSLLLALIPPLLARRLGSDEFAVWLLVVQMASYVLYAEFGIQTAVSKTAATAFASGDVYEVGGPMSAGVRLLTWTGMLGVAITVMAAIGLPTIFDIPPALVSPARSALLILGVTAALALPGSAVYGALLGIGRNGIVASATVVARLLSVGLTLVGASLGWSLPFLALALASGSLLNAVLPFVVARWLGLPAGRNHSTSEQRGEIVALTMTFAAFTVSTLLVTGIDVFVVGVVDFNQVAAYGLGASLVAVVSAGYTVMFTVLLPAFAESAAGGDRSAAERLVVRSTTLSSWLLATGLVVAFALAPVVLRIWAGAYAEDAEPIFRLLMAAGIVRLSALPLVQFLIGVGEHQRARFPAIGEALLNLVLSIALGVIVGARGVAIATLVAATVSLAYYLLKLAPSILGSGVARSTVAQSYLIPGGMLAIAIPLVELRRTPLTALVCVVAIGFGLQKSRAAILASA